MYYNPSTYYVSPLDAANDPALAALYGGADPFAGLTPEQQQYVSGLDAYSASQPALDNGYFSVSANPFSNLGSTTTNMLGTSDPVAQMGYLSQLMMDPNYGQTFDQPYEQNIQYTQNIAGSNELAGMPTVDYNTPMRLVNNQTGEVVYEGTGFEGLQAATQIAEQLSSKAGDGGDAFWGLYTAPAGTTDWQLAAEDTPDVSGIGVFAKMALPVVGMALGGPLGAGLGAALGGAIAGDSIGNVALNSALSAGMAYGGGNLLGNTGLVGGELGNAAGVSGFGALGGSAAGSAAGAAPGTILVQAPNFAVPALSGIPGSAIAAATSGASAPNTGTASTGQGYDGNLIQVSADPYTGLPNFGLGAGTTGLIGGTGILAGQLGGAGVQNGVANGVANSADTGNVINVTSDPYSGLNIGDAALGAGAIGGAGAAAGALGGGTPATGKPAADPADASGGLGVTDWLQLGSYGIGILDSLFGGGGGGNTLSPGALMGSGGALNPIFSGQLPAPTTGNAGARQMPDQDWNKYAFSGEQSFFNNVPQGGA